MKKSELIAKLDELFGEEDVEIYLNTSEKSTFTGNFNIFIDKDGDAVIKP